jgi:hypothetical protein
MRNLPLKTCEGLCYLFPCFSSISGSLCILKCDGARPKCRACNAQASACVYAAPANLLAKRQKETIEELENDKRALYEILFCLQTKSPEQATALLAFLRSDQGGDMGVILQRFSQYSQGSSNHNDHSDATFHSSEQCDVPLTSSITDAASNLARPVDARGLLQQDMAAAVPRRTHSTTVHDLAGPLQWFFNCAALVANTDIDALPEDMIRRECVKVSIIKTEMLYTIPKTAPVLEEIVFKFQSRLQVLHDELPDWMGFHQLIMNEQSDLMNRLRPVIYYVHLFFLSALMLLSRRLIIAYVVLDATGRISLPSNSHRAIRDGFVAAEHIASITEFMLSEGKVVQMCWRCM